MTRLGISAHLLVALLVALVCATDSAGAKKSVEGGLEEINRFPPAERQRKLVEGAKKEGEVVWYSTMNRENSFEVSQAFEKGHDRLAHEMGGALYRARAAL